MNQVRLATPRHAKTAKITQSTNELSAHSPQLLRREVNKTPEHKGTKYCFWN